MWKTILISLFCVFPGLCLATEWIDCYSGKDWFAFLVSPSEQSIVDFQAEYNGKGLSKSDWTVILRKLDFETETMEVVLKANLSGVHDFFVSAKGQNGTVHIGEKIIETECIWDVGGD